MLLSTNVEHIVDPFIAKHSFKADRSFVSIFLLVYPPKGNEVEREVEPGTDDEDDDEDDDDDDNDDDDDDNDDDDDDDDDADGVGGGDHEVDLDMVDADSISIDDSGYVGAGPSVVSQPVVASAIKGT